MYSHGKEILAEIHWEKAQPKLRRLTWGLIGAMCVATLWAVFAITVACQNGMFDLIAYK